MKNLLTGKTLEGTNYNIYELESLNELNNIYGDNNDTYYYNEYQFKVKRIRNDINGNPMYKLILSKNFENITAELKGLATRTYKTKGYAVIQSYNLNDSLKRIFAQLENK